MIQEEYVTYETAKLLKAAGFPQDEDYKYYGSDEWLYAHPDECDGEHFAVPNQSQVMRWLREFKNVAILFEIITPSEAHDYDLNVGFFMVDIYDTETGYHLDIEELDSCGSDMVGYPTYEDAVEVGIQAVCKHIITKGGFL